MLLDACYLVLALFCYPLHEVDHRLFVSIRCNVPRVAVGGAPDAQQLDGVAAGCGELLGDLDRHGLVRSTMDGEDRHIELVGSLQLIELRPLRPEPDSGELLAERTAEAEQE